MYILLEDLVIPSTVFNSELIEKIVWYILDIIFILLFIV